MFFLEKLKTFIGICFIHYKSEADMSFSTAVQHLSFILISNKIIIKNTPLRIILITKLLMPTLKRTFLDYFSQYAILSIWWRLCPWLVHSYIGWNSSLWRFCSTSDLVLIYTTDEGGTSFLSYFPKQIILLSIAHMDYRKGKANVQPAILSSYMEFCVE